MKVSSTVPSVTTMTTLSSMTTITIVPNSKDDIKVDDNQVSTLSIILILIGVLFGLFTLIGFIFYLRKSKKHKLHVVMSEGRSLEDSRVSDKMRLSKRSANEISKAFKDALNTPIKDYEELE